MRTNWVQQGVAERMKEAAKKSGLSVRQIAAKMEVSSATIYRWWEGERGPTPERVEAYAAAVGVPVSWIYRQTDEMELRKEFGEWLIEFTNRVVRQGQRADEAYDAITGAPDDLSLRERRMLQANSESIRRYLATLPEDEEARRQILLHLGSTLGKPPSSAQR